MEMNTRLQVEHPVTEAVTGLDLVQHQIRIAANEPLALAQESIAMQGHAIECRINAEDPDQGFRPSPGVITACRVPDGARFDTHIEAGSAVTPHYDSLLGKLIVHAADRPRAIAAMSRALAGLRVEGVSTTIPLHRRLMQEPAFASGDYDVELMDRMLAGAGRGAS
jgi:acetyl-CoA carboxylase biotin carboxylase subunit